jgi:DNA topoisomerase I
LIAARALSRSKSTSRRGAAVLALHVLPEQAAAEAGLRYTSDSMPGIRRRRSGRGFSYSDASGELVRDRKQLARIKALVIPPAWHDVWICASPNGHLQATGRDARGRKQYRYHPKWREIRDSTKYERLIAFGEALPNLRQQVDADLSKRTLSRERILATVVRLLDETLIRVGNEEYARQNNSFGLTTLRSDHAGVSSTGVRFRFRGKSGKEQEVAINDRRVARVVGRCQELPGEELFQYVDEDEEVRTIDSADVNHYLRGVTGEDFTAKDFRTWGGSVLALDALLAIGEADTQTAIRHNLVVAVNEVAERLRNTPAICRSSYIHPAIIEAYQAGRLTDLTAQNDEPASGDGLSPEEQRLLRFLSKAAAERG